MDGSRTEKMTPAVVETRIKGRKTEEETRGRHGKVNDACMRRKRP
jgi:hypothetical protein